MGQWYSDPEEARIREGFQRVYQALVRTRDAGPMRAACRQIGSEYPELRFAWAEAVCDGTLEEARQSGASPTTIADLGAARNWVGMMRAERRPGEISDRRPSF